jgi:hypothetical protein
MTMSAKRVIQLAASLISEMSDKQRTDDMLQLLHSLFIEVNCTSLEDINKLLMQMEALADG